MPDAMSINFKQYNSEFAKRLTRDSRFRPLSQSSLFARKDLLWS